MTELSLRIVTNEWDLAEPVTAERGARQLNTVIREACHTARLRRAADPFDCLWTSVGDADPA